jgi:hypothetical protein
MKTMNNNIGYTTQIGELLNSEFTLSNEDYNIETKKRLVDKLVDALEPKIEEDIDLTIAGYNTVYQIYSGTINRYPIVEDKKENNGKT